MKISLLAGLAMFAMLGVACLWMASGRAAPSGAPGATRQSAQMESHVEPGANPVIVELFTSEGCSSCPPADRLLARLEQTQPVASAQIIALEQHVDYWNDLSWMDPFSSAQFSERQSDYVRALHADSAYTPQMVVDGATGFVGSDERDALAAIAKSSRSAKATVVLERGQDSKAGPELAALRVRLEPPLTNWDVREGADVVLAITENGLTSSVTRGENAGAQLGHRAVVREMRVLGQVNSAGSFAAQADLKLGKNWKRENLRAVVFIQTRWNRHILGAAAISLAAPGSGS
jgi:hypothetical protein